MSRKRAADVDMDEYSPDPGPLPSPDRGANDLRSGEKDPRKKRRLGQRPGKVRQADRYLPPYRSPDQRWGNRRPRSPQARERVPDNTPAERKSVEDNVNNQVKASHNRNDLSSRIHSLRKLLEYPHSKMPADVRQDKERELASMILEQRDAQIKKKSRKVISKYHYVRFLERQQAEKRLAKLLREDEPEKNARDIETLQVDVNYAIYAPLDQKYISLFPRGPRKIPCMSKADQSRLTDEEKAALFARDDDAINVARNLIGEKPPVWYEVEEAMKNGTLEALRDGKLGVSTRTAELPSIGNKDSAVRRAQPVKPVPEVPSWVHDNGEIAAEDLDSDADLADGGFFEPLPVRARA